MAALQAASRATEIYDQHVRPPASQASQASYVRICYMAALQASNRATALANEHPEASNPPYQPVGWSYR